MRSLFASDINSHRNNDTFPRQARRRARSPRRARPCLTLERLEDRTLPSVTWTGGNDDWSASANNWLDTADNSHHFPITGNDVVIANGATVTFNTTVELNTLTLGANSGLAIGSGTLTIDSNSTLSGAFGMGGGVLSGAGTVDIAGAFTWTGGTMSGGGTTHATNTASVTLSGASSKTLQTRNFVNDATLNLSGASLLLRDHSFFDNKGVFNVTDDADLVESNNADSRFQNDGTFNKSGTGTLTNLLGLPFDNNNTINVNSGTLRFERGGASTGGTWVVPAGGVLEFANNYTLDAASTVTGAGDVQCTSGAVSVNGTYAITGATTISSFQATAAFNKATTLPILNLAGGFLAGSGNVTVATALNWTSGFMTPSFLSIASAPNGATESGSTVTITTTSAHGLQVGGMVTLSNIGGGIGYDGTFTITSVPTPTTFTYTATTTGLPASGGGQARAGATIVPNTATFTISTIFGKELQGRILINNTTATLSGENLRMRGRALFQNNGTLSVTDEADFVESDNGDSIFQNNGAFIKTGAGTTTQINSLPFTNAGTVEVQSGTLSFNSLRGTYLSGTGTLTGGTWIIGSGTTLDLPANVVTNQANVILDGTGSSFPRFDGVATNGASGVFTIQNGRNFTPVGAFNNAGLVSVGPNSTFTLSNGGTSTGDWDVANTTAGQGLSLSTGTYLFDNGTDVTGAGSLNVNNGTLNIGDATADVVNINNLIVTNGAVDVVGTPHVNGALTMGLPGGAAATLKGSGDVTVSGLLTLITGTLTGSGTTFAKGGISFQIGAGNGFTLDGRTLDNASNQTAVWTGLSFTFSNGAVFNNDGTFDVQCDQNIAVGAGGTFNNNANAIFRKSAGAGNTTIGPTFNNAGTVDLQTGTTNFIGGGTSTGPWTIAAPATLQFGGGAFNLNPGSTVTGVTGAALFTSGTVNLADTYNVGATTIVGGTVNFNGAATTGTLSMGNAGGAGAFLDGSADVTINGLFTWSSGTMTGIGKTFANGGINFSPGGGGGVQLDGRQLDNASTQTATWTSSGSFVFINGAVFNNNGIFDDQVGGTLFGSGSGTTAFFNNIGTFKKSAGNDAAVSSSGQHLTFNNTGTVEARSGSLNLHQVAQFDSATSMLTSGTWKVFANATLTLQDGFSFTNNATIVLDGPNSNLNNTILANSGSFTIQNGRNFNPTIAFNNSGNVFIGANSNFTSSNGGTSTGDWDIAANGSLTIAKATYFFDDGTDVTGPGTLIVTDIGGPGTLEVGDNAADVVNVSNLSIIRGTVNATGTLHVSGTMNIGLDSGGLGILSGTGNVTVGGLLSLFNGNMSGPGTTSANGGMLLQPGGNGMTLKDGRHLDNNAAGTMTVARSLSFKNGAVFTNNGTFDLQDDAGMDANSNGGDDLPNAIINTGIFKKTGGTGALLGPTTILVPFNNNGGTVDVQTGQMLFRSGGTSTGPWTVAAAAQLSFFSSTYDLNVGSKVTGDGTVFFAFSTVNFADNYSASHTEIQFSAHANFAADSSTTTLTFPGVGDGPTLGGSGNFTVNGLLTWKTGTIAGAGTVFAKGDITLDGNSVLTGRTLDLAANHTLTWLSTGFAMSDGAVFNNHGTFDAQNDGSFSGAFFGGATPIFNNIGTFKKSTGTGTTSVGGSGQLLSFNNTGIVEARTGTLNLRNVVQVDATGTGTLTGGTWDVFNNSTLTLNSGVALSTNNANVVLDGANAVFVNNNVSTNNGSFTIQNGKVYTAPNAPFTNTGAVNIGAASQFILPSGINYTQTGGTTIVQGILEPAGSADIQGGTLTGNGTIQGDTTNAGTVAPGTSPGVLTVVGDYQQTAAGTLDIEIGGLGAGQFDQLRVDGDVTLGGSLNVALINGFVTTIGDSVLVLDKTSAGPINGTFNDLAEGDTFLADGPARFAISYHGGDGNDIVLTAVNTEPTLDAISDPAPILEDAGTQTINLTGISAGGADAQTLTVTATSSNPALIPNPTVSYTSPNATGSLTYTPVANQSGTAIITVTVKDDGGTANGGIDTTTRTFTVTVLAVNDAPTLDPISNPPAILEDAGLQTIALGGISAGGESQTLTVTATSSNPALIPDPTVTYSSPDAIGSLAYAPAANQSGTAVITVTVKDDGGTANGGVDTVIRTFTVTVLAVNDAPTLDLIPDPAAILEDAGLQTIDLTGISAGGGETQTLSITATSDNPALISNPGINYTSPNAGGSLSFTPAANHSGTAVITVTVHDNGGTANGGVDTTTRSFTVTVLPVNDAPTLDEIANPAAIPVNSGTQAIALSGIGAGTNEPQVLTVTATSDNPGLVPDPTVDYISPDSTGSLSYTPAANLTGTARITVVVRDDGGTANGGTDTVTRTFTVTVGLGINVAPTIDPIADPPTILQNAGTQTINLTGISAGAGDNSQTISVTAVSDNPSLIPDPAVNYTSPNSTGSLSFAPVANQTGTAVITVTVKDDGGTADGGTDTTTRTFTVTVAAVVNAAPTLDVIPDPDAILEDAAEQTVNLTGISAGGDDLQTLTVTARSSNPALIPDPTVTYSSPDATGSLAYTPVADQSGTAIITVTVTDDGGTANGGVDTVIRTFTVTVLPVNDAPTLDTIPDPAAVLEDAGQQTINLTGISAGGGESQTLTVTATSSNTALIPNPTIDYTSPNATGSLSYTPVSNQSGTTVITVTVADDGGTADGGVDTITRTFTITVLAVNDAPTLDSISDPTAIFEDAATQTINLSGISAGGGESQTLTVTAKSSNPSLIPDPNVTYSSPDAIGSLSFTPVSNQSGTAIITVTIRDNGGTANGGVDTTTRTFTVTVTSVNDAPTLAQIPDPAAILEDVGPQTINLTGINAGGGESQALTVTATSSNPSLIPDPTVTYTSPNPTGSLSYTPVANQSGTAVITVTVTDNGGTANGGVITTTRTFTVTVTPVNDAPTLDPISDPAAILEDAGVQTINLLGINAGGGESQTLTVTTTSSNTALIPNPTISYTSPNATGSLSYTPVTNQSGTAVITVTVTDDGGTANGGVNTNTRTFTVTVTPVNDAPTLDPISNPAATPENAGAQTINLSGISAGGGESQSLTVAAVSSNPALIPNATVAYTSPNATGSLSYTPVANQSGTAIITVTVTDDGDTANGGIDTITRTFTVTVAPTVGSHETHYFAVGAAAGIKPRITVFDVHGAVVANFLAFASNFRGGVRVAVGDVNGDGTADIIAAAGPGGRQHINVIDGAQLNQIQANGQIAPSALLASFAAYKPGLAGSFSIAAGDVNGDGRADIITGKDPGSQPRVKVIDAAKLNFRMADGRIAPAALLGDFLVNGVSFHGGVNVSAGDVDGDGKADIVAAPASGVGRVKVINATKLSHLDARGVIAPAAVLAGFFAYQPAFRGGVFVAAGDVNGDRKADIIVAPGPGARSQVKAIDAARLNLVNATGQIAPGALIANQTVFADSFRGGVRIGAVDLNDDGLAEILVGAGPTNRRLLGLDVLQHGVALDLALSFDAQSFAGD